MKRTYSTRVLFLLMALMLLLSPVRVNAQQPEDEVLSELFQSAITENQAIMQERIRFSFQQDPGAFIHVLSLEAENVQERIMELLMAEIEWHCIMNQVDFKELIYSVVLDDAENQIARDILTTLRTSVDEQWSLHNSQNKTDDIKDAELVYYFRMIIDSDGERTEALQYRQFLHFRDDPETFIHLLSLESEEVQNTVLSFLMIEAGIAPHEEAEDFVQKVYAVQLNDSENQAARDILARLKADVQEFKGEPDWASIDWTTFDWATLDDPKLWSPLEDWLEKDASFEQLFLVSANCAHAAFSEALSGVVASRFVDTPEEMLRALAPEEQEFQEDIFIRIIFDKELEEITDTLESVRLSQEDSDEAYAVLNAFVAYVEENCDVDIVIPKTGDGLTLVAAMLIFSAAGMALLVVPKKSGR